VDSRDLTALGLDPAAVDVIGRYLAAVECRLSAGRRYRARILAELADGLACATLEQTDAGTAPAMAARDAVVEFGDPRALAGAFTRQRGVVTAHRLGVGLVATGPLVGLAWLAASANGGAGWPARVADLLSALPQLPWILAVTAPAAIVAGAGAGRAARVLKVPARVATGAAVVAAAGCVAGDLSLLLTALLGHRPSAAGAVGVFAVAASGARLSAAGWVGRRVAWLRAAGR
jgi:hypothetical protein